MKRKRLAVVLGGAVLAFLPPAPAAALVINKTYNGLTASAASVIDGAVAFYQGVFSDPITVNIEFHTQSTGLGQSTTFSTTVNYATYRADLVADATSADDATALASLPAGAGNPVTNSGSVTLKTANARAIGIATGVNTFTNGNAPASGCLGYTGDSCIGLNLGLTDDATPGAYSLLAVVEHEIDEALGLGSSLGGLNAPTNPEAEDLFRWASAGVRSFATNSSNAHPCAAATPVAYLSIDGGATNLNAFNNCANGGDYADWITHTPTQVQDAFTNNSGAASLTIASPEVVALDVIGYTLTTQAMPEPASLALLGPGLLGLGFSRRRGHCLRVGPWTHPLVPSWMWFQGSRPLVAWAAKRTRQEAGPPGGVRGKALTSLLQAIALDPPPDPVDFGDSRTLTSARPRLAARQ